MIRKLDLAAEIDLVLFWRRIEKRFLDMGGWRPSEYVQEIWTPLALSLTSAI